MSHSILRRAMAGLMRRCTFVVLVAVFVVCSAQHVAFAQTGAGEPSAPPAEDPVSAPPNANTMGLGSTPQAPVIQAPKLKEFAEPTFPPQALEQGLSGRVEVELVVGTDGRVKDPTIKTGAGNGFDEAALEAAARLLFEPARRNGTAIAARIVFPFVFEFRAPEPPAEPPPPAPAHIAGKVLEAGSDKPLQDIEVLLTAVEDPSATTPPAFTPRRALTAPDGTFDFGELPAGAYRLRLSRAELTTQEVVETVTPGEAIEGTYRMVEEPDKEAFRAVARVPPPPREVTRRTISKEEMTRIPGTRGDALRAIELLPGVARPPFGGGVIIIRGSAAADSQLLVEGIPLGSGSLYHFGGLTSFFNSRLLESIDFYPGNFSVRYGRKRGGIIELTVQDPARDGFHGLLDLNLIDGSAIVQGPITDKWGVAAAARRSWLDVTLGAALSSAEDISAVAAPVYYDYQLISTYRPTLNDKLRLLVYGSSDQFKLLFLQPTDADPAISGNFRLATQFHRAQVSWGRKVSDRIDHDLQLAMGSFSYEFGLGDAFDFSLKGVESYARSEWRIRATDRVRLIAGLDLVVIPGEVRYGGPPLQQQEGNPDSGGGGASPSNRSRVSAGDKFTVVQPGVYLESDLDLAPLHVVLGTRIDYYNEIEGFSFDPRLALHFDATPQLRLKGGVGSFTQPPQFQESSVAFGNPFLKPTHTVHTGLGFDYTPVPGIKLGLEGFYKYLYDRIIGTEYGAPPSFINGGKGRIYGLEVSARVDPRGRFFAILSYTLSRSERMDRTEGYHAFDFDQPHILTLSSVYRLGAGWEAGLTFRLVAGNPATPIIGAVYNRDTGLYSPVYGAVNSIRNKYFHRLDARIEKKWTFETWSLAFYLDVQNAYNATNAEGIAYDFEYRRSAPIRGLPILPSLGLRGEL
jgi:TonB family protein